MLIAIDFLGFFYQFIQFNPEFPRVVTIIVQLFVHISGSGISNCPFHLGPFLFGFFKEVDENASLKASFLSLTASSISLVNQAGLTVGTLMVLRVFLHIYISF